MYKIILAVTCLAALAAALPYKQVAAPEYYDHKDTHYPAEYKFEYGVNDGHTGDHKTQWEHRDGDHVKGQYTLNEANGGHRVVDYESDAHGGIQIQVKSVSGHGPAPKVHQPAHYVPAPIDHHYGGDSYTSSKNYQY
ncbi:cuticle protein 7-like [Ochlerotatus camptorhynchus]|uniref:cuticle protein 7-like n=1 Tax=Ochlerotatus camptorhynchus TaxID=644619 RepID=UPI0031E12B5B